MAVEISMPQLSDTMDEGTILTWLKSEGDSVSRGDALAEVATDKADLEIECFHEGTLLKIYSTVGTTVQVGEIIAVIGEAGEAVPAREAAASAAPTPVAEEAPAATPVAPAVVEAAPVVASTAPTTVQSNGDGRIKISPLARNIAQSNGIDYTKINGTGEAGRITRKDVEGVIGSSLSATDIDHAVAGQAAPTINAQQAVSPAPAATPAPKLIDSVSFGSTEALSKMRQTIADRMVQSVTTSPHFYATARINVTKLMELRATLKPLAQYEGITFNHLVVKAVAGALKEFPRINSFYKEGTLVTPADVNIGVITALPDGLLIPVVKKADTLPLAELVSEANALVSRARAGRPKADDLSGGTFSISNIGKANVESFTAIINPGQGAILSVAGIQDEVIPEGGKPVVAKTMRVTVAVDHRIIDGVIAGQFVSEVKRLLEEPVLLLA